jgi:hypothetical protein
LSLCLVLCAGLRRNIGSAQEWGCGGAGDSVLCVTDCSAAHT